MKITYKSNSFPLCCFSARKSLLNPQSFQTTMSEGGGLEKHFCELARFSLEEKSINHTVIPFVSTTSVCDCSAYFQFLKHLEHFIATSSSPIPLPTPPPPQDLNVVYHRVNKLRLGCCPLQDWIPDTRLSLKAVNFNTCYS